MQEVLIEIELPDLPLANITRFDQKKYLQTTTTVVSKLDDIRKLIRKRKLIIVNYFN